MKIVFLIAIMILCRPQNTLGQIDTSTGSLVWLNLDYSIQWPFADLQKRFGQNFALGGGVGFLSEGGLFASIDYALLFGAQVKEDVLSNLRTNDGSIVGRDQQLAEIFLRERGHQTSLEAGFYFGDKSQPKRNGIILSAGLGWFQHKIRIIDEFDAVNQVKFPYNKGYDRLSSGFSIHQSIKYLYLSENRLVNFLARIDIMQAFTKDRRGINYNTGEQANANRLDILAGVGLSWIIPIYLKNQSRYY